MVGLTAPQVAHTHVCVPDRLHLEEVVLLDEVVELAVELIQHAHHLLGRQILRDAGEPHDVAEEDGHLVEMLRLRLVPRCQLLRHVRRQDFVQQALLAEEALHSIGEGGGVGLQPAHDLREAGPRAWIHML
jgi:hypothetical protein